MHFSNLVAGLAAVASVEAYTGFNYASTENGAARSVANFAASFNKAKSLVGTDGEFTSARLYTMIQDGTTNTPISAIQAAINTKTSLLLGLWASAGQANINNEIAALKTAIAQHGAAFTDLIAGISVGSEDLYRISPTGIANNSPVGAGPDVLVNYIKQVRAAVKGTSAANKIGHVDTWTAWVNGSNVAVIDNCDWLGMDAYPYFESTKPNSIADGKNLFFSAYDQTSAVAQGKPVWVTETGWPTSGATVGQAVPSRRNAEKFWQDVGCNLFGKVNTWWYILDDAGASPSFGVVGAGLGRRKYNLKCNNGNSA